MLTAASCEELKLGLPLAAMLVACGGSLGPPPSAPKDMRTLVVLADKLPTVTWAPADCAATAGTVASLGRRQLQTELAAAGFQVVTDPTVHHDLVMVATAHGTMCSPALFGGSVSLQLEAAGTFVASVSHTDSYVWINLEDGAQIAARALVTALVKSPKLLAFAERRPNERAPAMAESPLPSTPAAAQRPAPASATALRAAAPQPTSYALIVGIDRYRDIAGAAGARGDAERFAELARRTLGLKDDHVRVALEDHATKQDVERGLAWLQASVPAGGRAYFFFSGHGAPGTDQSTYLVPYDADARDLPGTGLAMAAVMKQLGATKGTEAIAFVDACFSGAGGRSILPPGARPLMRVKEAPIGPRLAVFSASHGDEISGPAPGENAGVFTKYLVEGLGTGQADADGDGQISLRELADWVGPRVAREAKKDKRDQHPSVAVGSGVGDPRNFIVEYGIGK